MYFSLIRLRRGLSPKDIAALGRSDGYKLHKMVWDIFSDGPERQRDFLYRFDNANGLPTYYTVSEREPYDQTGLWDVISKPYAPKIMQGERLAFKLRANPVQSAKRERTPEELAAWTAKQSSLVEPSTAFKRGWTGKTVRHDVVMEAKTRIDFKNLPEEQRPHVATLIQEAGLKWLASKEAEYGFSVITSGTGADGYMQHRFFKGKNVKPIAFSSLEFDGLLTVTNPGVFVAKCLFTGIGPAKGFGCGLMLVRRV